MYSPYPGWISDYQCLFLDVMCNQRAGSDHRSLAYDHTAHDDGSASDRRASFDDSRFQAPLAVSLREATGPGGARMTIVDEDDAVTDEDIVFDRDACTYEAMARDLAPLTDSGAPLNFDKRSHSCVVTDLASIEIDKGAQAHSFAQLNIMGHARVRRKFASDH